MGDTPVNLNSPEQMSWVIYSKKPNDKLLWGNSFSPYMESYEYKEAIKQNAQVLYKTNAKQCSQCSGSGHIRKMKKDGTPFARENNCHD